MDTWMNITTVPLVADEFSVIRIKVASMSEQINTHNLSTLEQ